MYYILTKQYLQINRYNLLQKGCTFRAELTITYCMLIKLFGVLL